MPRQMANMICLRLATRLKTNPIAETLSSWAKDNGLSQAQFDDLSGQLQSQAQEMMAGEIIDPAVEMKQLGPNANAVVNGMVDWARGLVNKGVWSKDDFDEFKIMGGHEPVAWYCR